MILIFLKFNFVLMVGIFVWSLLYVYLSPCLFETSSLNIRSFIDCYVQISHVFYCSFLQIVLDFMVLISQVVKFHIVFEIRPKMKFDFAFVFEVFKAWFWFSWSSISFWWWVFLFDLCYMFIFPHDHLKPRLLTSDHSLIVYVQISHVFYGSFLLIVYGSSSYCSRFHSFLWFKLLIYSFFYGSIFHFIWSNILLFMPKSGCPTVFMPNQLFHQCCWWSCLLLLLLLLLLFE